MSDSEYYYNYYRQRYYDSCSQISNCEHQIYNFKNQRQQVVNKINQLHKDIRDTQAALDGLNAVVQREGSLNSKLTVVENKTGQAASNFSGMVKASNIISKSITDVFGSETAKTKSALNRIWNTIKLKKNSLNTKLSNLQADLKQANNNLQNIDSNIRQSNSNLSYWKQKKSNNYYNMEYYRRQMMQAAW